ncbi:MAG TPA: hypothetical protein PLZ51_26295, partial [Aggregatilineales bacterium]|nr:hypothetical protein [Aggregatilineales bacterium]
MNGFTWIWDSNHILFEYQEGIHFDEDTQSYEDAHLYLMNIADGTLTKLTTHVNQCPTGEFYAQPTWSPVSQQLVFAMGCGLDALGLYLVQADSLDTLLKFDYISLSKEDSILRE